MAEAIAEALSALATKADLEALAAATKADLAALRGAGPISPRCAPS